MIAALASVRDLKLTVIVIGFVLLLPIVIPLGLILHALSRHRLGAAARRRSCPTCGQILGDRAIDLADAAWEEHLRQHRESAQSDSIPRMVRTIDAICPHCRARLSFIEGERSFELTSEDFGDLAAAGGSANQPIRF